MTIGGTAQGRKITWTAELRRRFGVLVQEQGGLAQVRLAASFLPPCLHPPYCIAAPISR